VVHGNLKPQNVLINEMREVKVTDFCLPRVDGPEFAAYLAPEFKRAGATPKTDLYACGALWHLMLTGEPRLGTALPSKRFPELPPTVDAIYARLSPSEPSFRYRDAGALMEDLDRLENELPPPEEDAAAPEPPPVETPKPPPARRRNHRIRRR
jgi:serine/threonine-protein kinase